MDREPAAPRLRLGAIPLALALAASLEGCATGPVATPPTAERPVPRFSQEYGKRLCGTILEVQAAASYTFLKVATESGEAWLGVTPRPFAAGERICVGDIVVSESFHSPTLGRVFDRVSFAEELDEGAPAAGAPRVITPPEGGRSIAEAWRDRKELAGRKVSVAGRVVSFSPDVMGVNWIRLKDGSGNRYVQDDVLSVTTRDRVEVGAIVEVTGILSADRDFGSGYAFQVVVEDGRVGRR
jgi:hypothetical protein